MEQIIELVVNIIAVIIIMKMADRLRYCEIRISLLEQENKEIKNENKRRY